MADDKIKLLPEIEQLTEKLLADPKSRVFAQLADAYRKCGMFDEAIDTAKRGLEIHPQYAVAHLILGRCYMSKKMYALAREEFELTVRNDPQNLVGFRLLAETYERQNMYPEAVKYYQMVLDLDPTNFDIAEKVENLKGAIKPDKPPKPEAAIQPPPVPEPEPPVAEPAPEPFPAEMETVSQPEAEPVPVQMAFEPGAGGTPEPGEPAAAPPEKPMVDPVPDILQDLNQALDVPEAPPAEETRAGWSRIPGAPAEPAFAGAGEPAGKTVEPSGSTATLAELYASQGHFEKAIEAYQELIASEPENQTYKDRMDGLLAKAFPEMGPAPELGPASGPPDVIREEPKQEKPVEEQTVELTGMFAEMEKLAAVPEPEPPKPTEESPKLESMFSLEEKPAQPAPEPAAAALGALFAEEPQAPSPPPEASGSKEEALPAGEPDEPKQDTVSSFQSWLNSIQK
ncbi:MAG TPA: hypothetical protein DDW31_00345 [candidate division Zixibacteria bacterium]|nr:hypothetical protein [candidate division Zixibacteria bacterium]